MKNTQIQIDSGELRAQKARFRLNNEKICSEVDCSATTLVRLFNGEVESMKLETIAKVAAHLGRKVVISFEPLADDKQKPELKLVA